MLGRARRDGGTGRSLTRPVRGTPGDRPGRRSAPRRDSEPGLGPVARAAAGTALGVACGAFTLVVLPRREASAGTAAGPS